VYVADAILHTPEDTPDKLDFGKIEAMARWMGCDKMTTTLDVASRSSSALFDQLS
jgi:hypothetical protein